MDVAPRWEERSRLAPPWVAPDPGGGVCQLCDGSACGRVEPTSDGVPLRLSWKFRLSWKLLAAIVAKIDHVSHMFHDNVTVVDYRREMVFRVTARPPLGRRASRPRRAWPARASSGGNDGFL